MILKELINIIEKNYPLNLAYSWDNPGLILGDSKREIKKAFISLDVTSEVIEEAIKTNSDCIISHHPFIFSGLKQINSSSLQGSLILKCAENKIALYSAHTNMDTAPEGINKKLSDMFSLKNSEIIEKNDEIENAGLGRIGNINEISLNLFLDKVKSTLKTPFVRYSGNKNQIIKRVAIGSGSCSELIPKAISMGADTIITGDLKYHTCLDYAGDHFSIIDAGHFPTEQIIKDMFYEILKNTDVELIKSNQQDIFNIY